MTDEHSITIRAASIDDFRSIFEFMKRLESQEFNEVGMREIFQLNLSSNTIIYLVATVNEQVTGFISCYLQSLLHHNALVGEIQEFYVAEVWRGKKVGLKLLTNLKNLLLQQGVSQLEVTSNLARIASHKFYQLNGFKESHKKFTTSLSS